MTTTLVNFSTDEGAASYKEKVYFNHQIFKGLFGGSPSDFADKLKFPSGLNNDLMQFISDKYEVPLNYVKGINLSDECINMQSAAQLQVYLAASLGCTSVARGHIIGQTLDLFDLELCIIRENDSIYVTMPPYLALLGLGSHIAMCTNHLFDVVNFEGAVPISHIRRDILRAKSLDDAISYVTKIKPTTAVNFLLSDGDQSLNVELNPKKNLVCTKAEPVIAHTNHVITSFKEDRYCARLNKARELLLDTEKSVADILDSEGIVQPLANGFGTIISVWIDPKKRILAYRDPHQKEYTELQLEK